MQVVGDPTALSNWQKNNEKPVKMELKEDKEGENERRKKGKKGNINEEKNLENEFYKQMKEVEKQ